MSPAGPGPGGRIEGGCSMGDKTVEISPGITVDPQVSFGKPVIKGTRIPVDLIMDQLAAGSSYDEVQQAFGVGRDDILAVLRYAADVIAQEEVVASVD
jgi:uncharacterized protein (DUF433 family)